MNQFNYFQLKKLRTIVESHVMNYQNTLETVKHDPGCGLYRLTKSEIREGHELLQHINKVMDNFTETELLSKRK